ncbi:MAG TPA: tRNA glutamyl-Q(34) synthetase GluQRS [Candidatus Binatia bacterium]|jgi:glutamyl/glutaminyl-tRNA synthetase|nr:tRNA glutamyl-Q(34) synthetase GluQRS [Candidatus Binatia bacterium]
MDTKSRTHTSLAPYRGRLAPSPTGFLHLGHAHTFWIAQQRARNCGGTLVLRNEDLDKSRAKPQFVAAMLEDLRWFGFEWQEGPDRGGAFGPYTQSERGQFYVSAFEKLREGGFIYPCTCSRQDVLRALQAPHAGEDEPVYPGTCRPGKGDEGQVMSDENILSASASMITNHMSSITSRSSPVTRPSLLVNWRFRVPDGEVVSFIDGHYGSQRFVAGKDFGDFIIWRHDDIPAYQLAVVVDDAAMQITEVVRGKDLLKSTSRQLLLYRALGLTPPTFYHCPLVTDESGLRLAKRHEALSLRSLRAKGCQPEELMKDWYGSAAEPI